MGLDAMILVFLVLSVKPVFYSPHSILIKRLFIFPLAILTPACDSSSPGFHTMYSVYKLNKEGDNASCSNVWFYLGRPR